MYPVLMRQLLDDLRISLCSLFGIVLLFLRRLIIVRCFKFSSLFKKLIGGEYLVTKIKFSGDDYRSRLLLKRAIIDYMQQESRTLCGQHNASRKSLLGDMQDAGMGYSKNKLDRVSKASKPGARRESYPPDAILVAKFLSKRKYFPPGQNIDEALEFLPLFFGGLNSNTDNFLDHIAGKWSSFQYSNYKSGTIITAQFTFKPRTEWGYCVATEKINTDFGRRLRLTHEGVAFSDETKKLYIVTRERKRDYPRFFLFDECDRVGEDDTIETIYGNLIGGAPRYPRHLSPIALYRGPEPIPEGPVTLKHSNKLPKYVAKYLKKKIQPGHGGWADS